MKVGINGGTSVTLASGQSAPCATPPPDDAWPSGSRIHVT